MSRKAKGKFLSSEQGKYLSAELAPFVFKVIASRELVRMMHTSRFFYCSIVKAIFERKDAASYDVQRKLMAGWGRSIASIARFKSILSEDLRIFLLQWLRAELRSPTMSHVQGGHDSVLGLLIAFSEYVPLLIEPVVEELSAMSIHEDRRARGYGHWRLVMIFATSTMKPPESLVKRLTALSTVKRREFAEAAKDTLIHLRIASQTPQARAHELIAMLNSELVSSSRNINLLLDFAPYLPAKIPNTESFVVKLCGMMSGSPDLKPSDFFSSFDKLKKLAPYLSLIPAPVIAEVLRRLQSEMREEFVIGLKALVELLPYLPAENIGACADVLMGILQDEKSRNHSSALRKFPKVAVYLSAERLKKDLPTLLGFMSSDYAYDDRPSCAVNSLVAIACSVEVSDTVQHFLVTELINRLNEEKYSVSVKQCAIKVLVRVVRYLQRVPEELINALLEMMPSSGFINELDEWLTDLVPYMTEEEWLVCTGKLLELDVGQLWDLDEGHFPVTGLLAMVLRLPMASINQVIVKIKELLAQVSDDLGPSCGPSVLLRNVGATIAPDQFPHGHCLVFGCFASIIDGLGSEVDEREFKKLASLVPLLPPEKFDSVMTDLDTRMRSEISDDDFEYSSIRMLANLLRIAPYIPAIPDSVVTWLAARVDRGSEYIFFTMILPYLSSAQLATIRASSTSAKVQLEKFQCLVLQGGTVADAPVQEPVLMSEVSVFSGGGGVGAVSHTEELTSITSELRDFLQPLDEVFARLHGVIDGQGPESRAELIDNLLRGCVLQAISTVTAFLQNDNQPLPASLNAIQVKIDAEPRLDDFADFASDLRGVIKVDKIRRGHHLTRDHIFAMRCLKATDWLVDKGRVPSFVYR